MIVVLVVVVVVLSNRQAAAGKDDDMEVQGRLGPLRRRRHRRGTANIANTIPFCMSFLVENFVQIFFSKKSREIFLILTS
jgi:hypothetical protein